MLIIKLSIHKAFVLAFFLASVRLLVIEALGPGAGEFPYKIDRGASRTS